MRESKICYPFRLCGQTSLLHIILFSLLLGLLGACNDDVTNSTKRSSVSHPVVVARVSYSPMSAQQILAGTLEAFREVAIFNEEEGRILAIPVYPGDKVTQGQLIIQLNDELAKAELLKAKAAHKQAKLNFNRLRKLKARRLTTEDALSRAATELELARAEESLLQIRYNRTRIKALFAGVISARLKEPGDIVARFNHILTLTDVSRLKAKANISELLLPHLKLNDKLSYRIDATGGQQHTATITRIYPTIDRLTRQGTFEITLDKPPQQAKPGQLVRIVFTGTTTPRLHIPLVAVKHDFSGAYVYVINNENKANRTPIQTGVQLGNNIEVISGLTNDERVVTRGFLGLKDKKTVTIVKNKSATTKSVEPQ